LFWVEIKTRKKIFFFFLPTHAHLHSLTLKICREQKKIFDSRVSQRWKIKQTKKRIESVKIKNASKSNSIRPTEEFDIIISLLYNMMWIKQKSFCNTCRLTARFVDSVWLIFIRSFTSHSTIYPIYTYRNGQELSKRNYINALERIVENVRVSKTKESV